MLRWGSFLRLPGPIYYRRIHALNYHKENKRWPDDKKLDDWTTVFTGFLEAVLPVCNSMEERMFFQHYILDRLCVLRPDQAYNLRPSSIEQSGTFMLRCFERLVAEGLHDQWLLPQPLQVERDRLLRSNVRLARENEALRNSRALRLARSVRSLLGRKTR